MKTAGSFLCLLAAFLFACQSPPASHAETDDADQYLLLDAKGPEASQRSETQSAPSPASKKRDGVVVNGKTLSSADLNKLRTYGIQVQPGGYWYDNSCGLWGHTGGASVGSILPGLALGSKLDPKASGGASGVFINGRQLPAIEVQRLSQWVKPKPGRWWLDGYGNFGQEGNPYPQGNLIAIAQQQYQQQQQQQRPQARQGGSSYYKDGTSFGSDKNFSYFSHRNSDGSFSSVTILDGEVVY